MLLRKVRLRRHSTTSTFSSGIVMEYGRDRPPRVATQVTQVAEQLFCSFREPSCVLLAVPCLGVNRPLTSLFQHLATLQCSTTASSKVLCYVGIKPNCDIRLFSLRTVVERIGNKVLVSKIHCYYCDTIRASFFNAW